MLSRNGFIRGSLETHLFFARIMKEHSFFIQAAFTPRDTGYIERANSLRTEFDKLLLAAVNLSNGIVSPGVIASGEIVTPYTIKAEEVSSFYTGIMIPTSISQLELTLTGSEDEINDPQLEHEVYRLNQVAICLISDLIAFKENIIENVLSCNLFTMNYPMLLEHILREAKLYLKTIKGFQSREVMNMEKQIYEQEAFWNTIMAEHSKFIRGLLDPSEEMLMGMANDFANEFDALTTGDLDATERIKEFNTQATAGLIGCKIKSIILPLLGDHVLRESNHFIRLLTKFSARE